MQLQGHLYWIFQDAKKIDELTDHFTEHVFGAADSARKRKNIELASLGSQIYDFFIFWDNYLKEKRLMRSTCVLYSIHVHGYGITKAVIVKQLPAAPQLL